MRRGGRGRGGGGRGGGRGGRGRGGFMRGGGRGGGRGRRGGGGRRGRSRSKVRVAPTGPVEVYDGMTTKELASRASVRHTEALKLMRKLGEKDVSLDTVISAETAELFVLECDMEAKISTPKVWMLWICYWNCVT